MRKINDEFIRELKEGCLSFFLEQVKNRKQELCLEIRNGYINIYYKGGNLLRITQKKNGYNFYFDAKYCLNKGDDSNYTLLNSLNPNAVEDYIKSFETMMTEMDSWLEKHPKARNSDNTFFFILSSFLYNKRVALNKATPYYLIV